MTGQPVELWPVKQLADICEIFTDGNWIESKDQSPSGIRLVQTGNIGEGVFKDRKDKARYISESKFSRLNCSEIFEGDCLISRLPRPVGRACLIPNTGERMITAVDCSILRFKQDMILPQFFVYYSQSAHYNNQIQPLCTGSTRKRISRKNLGKIKIPIPPLDVQQRIVSILDGSFNEINSSIASTESSLIATAEIFPSKLHEIYSEGDSDWSNYTLAEVSLDFGRGKSKHRPRNFKPLYGGPYPFVQTGDVRSSNHFISEYTQTYSEMGLAQSKLWPKGTVCITIAANIAETAILDFDACFPDSVIGVVVNPEITTNEYVEYALQFLKNKLQKEGKGSAQDNINMGTFKELKFPFAPLSEQKEIVDLLNLLNEQTLLSMKSNQDKIKHLDELKQSVLQEAFNGPL